VNYSFKTAVLQY